MTSGQLTDQAPKETWEPDGVSSTNQRRSHGSIFTWSHLIALLFTLVLIALSLSVGVYDILGADDGADIFLITRIPRTITLVLSGAVLAMCGLVMQMISQNRFVEPTTTGTTEWAALGLLIALICFPGASLMVKMLFAVGTAFLGTLVFFAFLNRVTLRSSIIVPIVGIMLGGVVGSFVTFLALEANLLQSLAVWFQGSFTGAIKGQYEPVWAVLVVVVIVFIAADRFTAIGLGQDFATNLGLNYRRVVLLGTGLIALATGIITVVVGQLPFLGLIVPNLVSIFRGDDLRSNLPWVVFTGIWVVTICDILARVILMPFEVPVAIILAFVGASVFCYLLLRGGKHG